MTPSPHFKFDISRQDYDRAFHVKAWKELEDGMVATMSPVTIIRHGPDTPCPEAMHLTPKDCQSLMDSLWDAGIRPSQGHGSTGQLAAVQNHLEDTRGLLAKVTDALIAQLPKKKP
jgi:hypothetical protein